MFDSWILRKRVEARLLANAILGSEPEPKIPADVMFSMMGVPPSRVAESE